MVPVTLAQIAEAVHGRLTRPEMGATMADGCVTDSRQCTAGTVFVAIKGERVDGHDYVGSVDAAAAIVDHEVVGAAVPQIVVEHTVRALGDLARYNLARRRELDSPFDIVGLTGSVGKTTTKDLLASLLGELGETVAPIGSFNNEIGLPLTALRVGASTRFFVAEMGANHVGEIAGLTRIAPPDVDVVLKVGVAHLGEFGSRERIAQAKSEIIRGLVPNGVAVLNADDDHVAAMAGIAPGSVLWFGVDAAGKHAGTVTARDIRTDASDHAAFSLCAADGSEAAVTLGIAGVHNVMNALAAATVALHYGMGVDAVARVLSKQRRISPHRMDISAVKRDGATFTLIDDSFNANPDSMRAGLDGLKAYVAGDHAYRVAVLGAMLELGGDERALHAGIGDYAARLGIDALIAVGSRSDEHLDALAGALSQGASQASDGASVDWVHDIDQADHLVETLAGAHPHTVVLLKGSHASGLSALAERWLQH